MTSPYRLHRAAARFLSSTSYPDFSKLRAMKIEYLAIRIVLMFGFIAFLPRAKAVVPAPDGGYPGGNTAEGQSALLSLTTGGFNSAVGWLSLRSNTTGQFNTAIGAGALLANTTANQNTATGAGALFSNTISIDNTALGLVAIVNVTTAYNVMCIGAARADVSNTCRIGNIRGVTTQNAD